MSASVRCLLVSSLTLGLLLASSQVALAQRWGVTPSGPAPVAPMSPAPMPDGDAPHTHHVVRDRLMITGITFLALGYVGAAVWGSYYLASLHLGPVDCSDQYGGLHFVPVIGPVIGMFAGGGCIHDSLHVEEAIMPVLFSAVQLAGLIMTIVGALGRDVPDDSSVDPSFGFSADASGGYAWLRGAF